jgi:hypothetical protein
MANIVKIFRGEGPQGPGVYGNVTGASDEVKEFVADLCDDLAVVPMSPAWVSLDEVAEMVREDFPTAEVVYDEEDNEPQGSDPMADLLAALGIVSI